MKKVDWQRTSIAAERTHHLLDGCPLYQQRFTAVMKYHAPGLAPVRDESGSFHIGVDGSPLYERRYRRTFGYYDGLAGVVSDAGWFHIDTDGQPLYPARYRWVGNFQSGLCTIRLPDGRYRHVDRDGNEAYAETYRYAGDFRNGAAVVQNDEGLHTHIDREGGQIHGRWFEDLGVFHKAIAPARDEVGWHHIDRDAGALYQRRFAEVEPFYNGQARVRRFDGGLEVIDESGERVLELRGASTTAEQELSEDMVGFWKTQTICVGAGLGVFDALPASAAGVAQRLEVSADKMTRLFRALWELDLVQPKADGRWESTESGDLLASGGESEMDAAASVWGGDHYRQWQRLPEILRGEPPQKDRSYFKSLSGRELEHYQRAMTGYARRDYAALPDIVDWSRHECVVDAGGGQGALLYHLLNSNSGLDGVLLELPRVTELVQLPAHLEERVRVAPGDFFESWPVPSDAVVMARVLHDWKDSDAGRILRRAREALKPGGRLYVIEMLPEEERPNGGLLDLNMLVMTGGRERTIKAWRRLFDENGFELLETRSLPSVSDILIAGLK